VPVEVLRCVSGRYLAREGFDGVGGEVILFFEGFCRVMGGQFLMMGTIHQLPKIQQNPNYLIFLLFAFIFTLYSKFLNAEMEN
jgi:hypothetical protein